jgi:hypothetical protein
MATVYHIPNATHTSGLLMLLLINAGLHACQQIILYDPYSKSPWGRRRSAFDKAQNMAKVSEQGLRTRSQNKVSEPSRNPIVSLRTSSSADMIRFLR